jgi:16S rRNA (cytidine1402-2'-O)-methyltransferase
MRPAEPNRRVAASKPAPDASNTPAGLHLVATPIGNLGDITARALDVLRGVDRILCEDTRVTGKLLARYAIKRPLDPYHDHNAERARPGILAALRRGDRLALVSDAGTPLVSDPGYKLVREALAEGLPVTAAPGASAALTALILSGLPCDAFLFAGFPPPRQGARRRALERWATVPATLIFYEGASRLAGALQDMTDIYGDRPAAVARELTKLHEEVRRGALSELAAHYRDSGPPRGEVVVVVGGPGEPAATGDDAIDDQLATLLAKCSLRDAVSQLAASSGVERRMLYRRALALKSGKE